MVKGNASRMSRLALLTALSLIAHYLESLMPPLMAGLPVKLGLANVFSLVALLMWSPKEALLVTLLRCLMGPLLSGSPSSLLYSLTGGLLSWGMMSLLLPLCRRGKISPAGLSVAGSFAFNAGQLVVGALIAGKGMLLYFPLMSLLSLPTGLFVGFLAGLCARALGKPLKPQDLT